MPDSRKIATEIIVQIYKNYDVDKATNLSKHFEKLSLRDRSFVKFLVLNTLRRNGEVDLIISKFLKKPLPKKNTFIKNLLRISITQIIFLNLAEYSIVNTAVELSKKFGFQGLVNGLLRNVCRKKKELLSESNEIENLPRWIRKELANNFSNSYTKRIAKQIVLEPFIDIKIKDSQLKSKDWVKVFGGEMVFPSILRFKSKGKIDELPFFSNGFWWVQGLAATFPVNMINDIYKKTTRNSISVLDVGAAPGGKTFQLLESGYDLTSLEISTKRVSKLKENLKRLNFQTKIVCDNFISWEPPQKFDCILIDAPCTGSGLLQKKPEIMIRDKFENHKKLVSKQKLMIKKAATILNNGGLIIYSVCSILHSEGLNHIKEFVFKNKNFSLIKPNSKFEKFGNIHRNGTFMSTLADFKSVGGIDGFFIACIKYRKN